MYNTSSDTVQFPQIWPHSALQLDYVSESVSFISLDIKMFVAGEQEVILSKRVDATEKLGHLKLLKKKMYFANNNGRHSSNFTLPRIFVSGLIVALIHPLNMTIW